MAEADQTSTGIQTSTTTSTTDSTDSTAENVQKNDPEKNKKLAEITIMEQLRETYNLTITIPKLLKGIHTNQFFFIPVTDNFYEKNYPEIVSVIANKKFARYAGFSKGRFFIEKVLQKGGVSGFSTEVTLNPLAPSLAEYTKMQAEAEKALIQAVNNEQETEGGDYTNTQGSGGGVTTVSGDCSETFGISTRSFDIEQTCGNMIGNSSANYAVDTMDMTGKEALMDVWNRFHYSYYSNNRTCPQKMWNKTGTISSNCADISRLCMCVGQVHGMKIGIRHMSGHYYNLIEWEGKTYRFDCCCKSGGYRGETTNTLLSRYGGPW